MQHLLLNVDDSILIKVIETLNSFPKDKLEIFDDQPTKADLTDFKKDLRNAAIEINELENGEQVAKTWREIRNKLKISL